eukprot:g18566.t1
MLSKMLTTDGVKFLIWPVMENADIIEQFRKLKEDTEVQSVVLLNCGASVDLQKLLEEDKLENLSKHNQRVIVLDDDPVAEARGERPPVEEFDESDQSDSDIEKENRLDRENEIDRLDDRKRTPTSEAAAISGAFSDLVSCDAGSHLWACLDTWTWALWVSTSTADWPGRS